MLFSQDQRQHSWKQRLEKDISFLALGDQCRRTFHQIYIFSLWNWFDRKQATWSKNNTKITGSKWAKTRTLIGYWIKQKPCRLLGKYFEKLHEQVTFPKTIVIVVDVIYSQKLKQCSTYFNRHLLNVLQ